MKTSSGRSARSCYKPYFDSPSTLGVVCSDNSMANTLPVFDTAFDDNSNVTREFDNWYRNKKQLKSSTDNIDVYIVEGLIPPGFAFFKSLCFFI